MSRRRSHKKNRRSSNARHNNSSSNSGGRMSVPTPRVNNVPQELPAQELPAQELPAQEQPAQELPAQELPAQEVPAQEVPAQELPAPEVPAQVLPPIEYNSVQPGLVYGDTYDIYLPINRAGPSMTMEELKAHPLMESLQKAMREKQFLHLDFSEK
ncbi:fibrous sheath CABYR-binding protein-like [Metopolophium dirhodum]|uniref:fibrous sheath CABYR-binding protein-like n=1 Tax=Metopolophium dirhodum TaxID=44670 RepID=UPI00298FACBD|nr:fibrous sheath CABYR-binding protein-like [Metopolophium dirhodum]XP_060859604.1 fibrous sheath CABYR-binding protein-like [Metopolophium dirhodum]